ncbi:MAG: NADH-quinone oxidoreductase subunit N [Desulfobacteraceae bacterium]|nr:NADH-quinone oxidoreductase subunit N [Desulfobacteraceae bacterium]
MEFRPELIIPELYQILLIGALFIQSIAKGNRMPRVEQWLPWLAGAGVVISVISLNSRGTLFSGSYKVDDLSQFFKMIVSLGFAIAVLNAIRQSTLEEEKRSEYFMFMALSAWGLMLLSSTVELISIYLALEVAAFSLFPLVPLRSEDKGAAEAAVKYIFFGAAATAIGLFGFSYILAAQHTTYLIDLAQKPWAWSEAPMAVMGLTLFLSAILFKLALFPFHFWAPDVYEGASNETAAYISTLPKVGAVVVLIRFASLLKPELEITTILAVLAAISITYGNLAALVQKDVKRLLGYSAIAHAGYVIVGLTAGTREGVAAAAFYAFIYVIMNFACFWVICRVATDGRNLKLDDLNGLYGRAPGLALVLAVGAMALVGLPPTAGFMGKLFLLTAAWNHSYNWLVVVAAANIAISIYYYLNLVRHAYTKEAPEKAPATIAHPLFSVFWGALLAALLIIFGILPGLVFKVLLPS